MPGENYRRVGRDLVRSLLYLCQLRIPSANPVNSAFFAEQVILEASFEREFRSHGLRQTVFQTEGGPENDLSAPKYHKTKFKSLCFL